MKIGLIVGSVRAESWNRKVAETVKDLFPEDFDVDFIEIKDLPYYDDDASVEEKEEAYGRFWEETAACDGFIFFSPEYNRSFAPAIKNALDVGSRNTKANSWRKKPAAVFSASMGGMGGVASNLALRQVFVYLNLIPMQSPEVYLAKIQDYYEDGKFVDKTVDYLQKAVDAYVDFAKAIDKAEF